jgi:hypothetical protein
MEFALLDMYSRAVQQVQIACVIVVKMGHDQILQGPGFYTQSAKRFYGASQKLPLSRLCHGLIETSID